MHILSRISLDKVNRKLEWFDNSFDRFDMFRSWIFNTCDSSPDNDYGGNNYNGFTDAYFNSNSKINSNTNIDSNTNIKANDNNNMNNNVNNNIKNNMNNNSSYTELLLISDDLNVGTGEMQRKIKKAYWRNKIANRDLKPSPIVIVPPPLSPLSHTSSSSSIIPLSLFSQPLSQSLSQSQPLPQSQSLSQSRSQSQTKIDENQNRIKVLIYQRDSSRTISNLEEARTVLQSTLGSKWDVQTIIHSEKISPCTMINNVRTATVLITPHGFQSILLLFQPYSSVLIEIHPSYYLKQEVYGFIQAGFRQNFNLARSYLAEESVPLTFISKCVINILTFFNFLSHDCMHSCLCRNIARRQDVFVSKNFMQRSAAFLSSHFIV